MISWILRGGTEGEGFSPGWLVGSLADSVAVKRGRRVLGRRIPLYIYTYHSLPETVNE